MHAEKEDRNMIVARRYSVASLVLAVCGGIYEYFSHGIYSFCMIYAFMIPMLLGALPHMIDKKGFFEAGGDLSEALLLASILTLSVGSVLRGVLEIYGTTNSLISIYAPLGLVMLAASLAVIIINKALRKAAG